MDGAVISLLLPRLSSSRGVTLIDGTGSGASGLQRRHSQRG